MQEVMRVILGAASVKAYVASVKPYQVIGIVRFGLEYGLLATDEAGRFFRVNGSQIIALRTQAVQRAIAVAREAGTHNFNKYKDEAIAQVKRAVPVVFRKQRHYTVGSDAQHKAPVSNNLHAACTAE